MTLHTKFFSPQRIIFFFLVGSCGGRASESERSDVQKRLIQIISLCVPIQRCIASQVEHLTLVHSMSYRFFFLPLQLTLFMWSRLKRKFMEILFTPALISWKSIYFNCVSAATEAAAETTERNVAFIKRGMHETYGTSPTQNYFIKFDAQKICSLTIFVLISQHCVMLLWQTTLAL